MSRAQEGAVVGTSADQNKVFNTNAQTSFDKADDSLGEQEGDIGAYQNQLSKFAAANPYGNGGAYQTAVDSATAGDAAGAGDAATEATQSAAVRGGINSSAGVAEGSKVAQQNTRDLMTTQAKANADRIAKGAGYAGDVLQASQVPATLQGAITGEEGKLAADEGGLAVGDLGIDQKASEDPNFGDDLGSAFAKSLGKFAGGS